jgi:hypothetical protein
MHVSNFPVPYTFKPAHEAGEKFIAAMAECARVVKVVSLHHGLLIRLGCAEALLNRATADSTELLNILAELFNFRAGLLNVIDSLEHLDFGPTQE